MRLHRPSGPHWVQWKVRQREWRPDQLDSKRPLRLLAAELVVDPGLHGQWRLWLHLTWVEVTSACWHHCRRADEHAAAASAAPQPGRVELLLLLLMMMMMMMWLQGQVLLLM